MTTVGKSKIDDLAKQHGDRFTWVNRTLVGKPKIDERPEQPYMGIRTQTPFKGMFSVADKLLKELNAWMKKQSIEQAGPSFLRYHIINMDGEMDIEVGIPVTEALAGDGRVCPGVLPAGRYASLIFIGNGYTGHSVLTRWGIENGLTWDCWDDPKGDAFQSRYEAFLTDPKIEPLKTRWEVEVAIKLAD
jgi:effector-binding domain-containing protein